MGNILDYPDEEFKPAELVFANENMACTYSLTVADVSEQRKRLSFLSENSIVSNDQDAVQTVTESPSDIEPQTPQNSRTMASVYQNSSELFSPGSFFASKSGNLGNLENDKNDYARVVFTNQAYLVYTQEGHEWKID
jgi:hypothetical protein